MREFRFLRILREQPELMRVVIDNPPLNLFTLPLIHEIDVLARTLPDLARAKPESRPSQR